MAWKESKLKAARMHIYVRRGGPNYQTGLARMRALGEELGVPLEVMVMEYIFTSTYALLFTLGVCMKLSCFAYDVVKVHLVHFLVEEKTCIGV